MGRPRITLQEWCEKDKKQKIDFFKAESRRENGLLWLNNNQFHPRLYSENSYSFLPEVILHTLHDQSASLSLRITAECFEQLKNRYKSVTKTERDRNLVKKQYLFKPAIANQIKKIKERNRWAREEDAIEHLVNANIQQITAHETYAKINQSPIRLATMHNEIKRLEGNIEFLENENNTILTRLAKSELLKDFYLSVIENHNIDKPDPYIDQNEINKKKSEISLSLRASFKAKT